MDAQAHLMSLGWAGPGHALDAHRARSRSPTKRTHRGLGYDPKAVRNGNINGGGNGLVKPLLISQRQGRLGIGKKIHEPAAGNEWWLAGFEKALGNIGKGNRAAETSGTSTPSSGGSSSSAASSVGYRGKHSGLYGCFVKGTEMEGTIDDDDDDDDDEGGKPQKEHRQQVDAHKEKRPKKRKSAEISGTPTSESARTRKTAPEGEDLLGVEAFLKQRDKDRKRRERNAKPDPFAEFTQIGKFFETADAETARAATAHDKENGTGGNGDSHTENVSSESKEDRRERRRRRREARALTAPRENGVDAMGAETAPENSDAAKVARQADKRRRRKGERRLAHEKGGSSPPFQVM